METEGSGVTVQLAAQRVFLSYSRKDAAFVHLLGESLRSRGFVADFDLTDCDPGCLDLGVSAQDEWWPRIKEMIAAAEVMVFVVSPDSVQSRVCTEELECARSLGKRIIPILRRAIDFAHSPERLRALNMRIAFESDDASSFSQAVDELCAELALDVDWHRRAAWLARAAQRWDSEGRPEGQLLRTGEVASANTLAVQRPQGVSPFGPLVVDFLDASSRKEEQDRRQLQRTLAASHLSEGLARARQGSSAEALPFLASAVRLSEGSSARVALLHQLAVARVPILELNHSTLVNWIAFDRLSRLVVTACEDGTARLWDVATGAPVGAPLHHSGGVWRASFSSDGQRVVTASKDGTARVWCSATGEAITPPLSHPRGEVSDASFSPDGSTVLTASDNGTGCLWNAATGASIGQPFRHSDEVLTARFDRTGRRVVTASYDGTARLWDATTGAPVGLPLRHGGPIWNASFNSDGGRVVTASYDRTARVWSAKDGSPIGSPMRHQANVWFACFDESGTRVATASEDRTARVWDAKSGSPLSRSLSHEDEVGRVSFSPDGTRLVSASKDGSVRLWDATTGAVIGPPFRHTERVSTACFNHDGTRLATASKDGTACIWDTTSASAIARCFPREHVLSMIRIEPSFSPDGANVLVGDAGTLRFWDSATMRPAGKPLVPETGVGTATFSPDGTRLLSTGFAGSAAQLWDVKERTPIGPHLEHGAALVNTSFSLDGQRAVTTSDDGIVRIWDTARGTPVGKVVIHEGLTRAAFNRDGTQLLTVSRRDLMKWDVETGSPAGPPLTFGRECCAHLSFDASRVATVGTAAGTDEKDSEVLLWDVDTGRAVDLPLRHRGSVRSVCFSRDGKRVATASADRTARLWDAETGKAVGLPLRHLDAVSLVEFSCDGDVVVTGSDDRTARIWDANSGLPVGPDLAHESFLRSARFSRDGSRLLTTDAQSTVYLWDVDVSKPSPAEIALLAQAAEAIAGSAIDIGGALVRLEDRKERVEGLRRLVAQAPQGGSTVSSFLRWVLTEPWQRSISPSCTITVPEFLAEMAGHPREIVDMPPGFPGVRMLLEGETEETDFQQKEAFRAYLGHPGLAGASPPKASAPVSEAYSACLDVRSPARRQLVAWLAGLVAWLRAACARTRRLSG